MPTMCASAPWGLGQEVAGELHIGCFQTVAPLILPRLIGALSRDHPGDQREAP